MNSSDEKAVQAVRAKTQLRDQLKQQLAEQAGQLKKMQEEAASLLQATRSMTSKLRVIKVPEGAVLRGCKKTRRKLREHGF
ncbi:hypothetical protein HaLaN_16146 [Haematococcus lacustris]|uniref:Uncharacterized protein n=1 Tax=Haematococcus lacustris TaxID=44745 RepID=A0A699ZTC5_HAELA|nr:hypothetical protein HaLaN_16146 [Haematococcus lacustris]